MHGSEGAAPQRIARLFAFARPLGAALVVLTVASGFGLARLDFSDNPRDIYSRDDDDSRLLDEVHAAFGADDTDILIVLDGANVLSRDALLRTRALVDQLRNDPNLSSVYSLLDARQPVRLGGRTVYWMIVPQADADPADFAPVRDQLLQHPLLRGRMVSEDGRMTIVVAQMRYADQDVDQLAGAVDQVRLAAERAFAGSPVRTRLTGQPLLRVETFHNLKTDQITFSVLCGVTLTAIALWLFRRPQPVLITLAGPGIGVVWTLGLMGWTGQRFDGINVVLPTLLFVIGFTDSLHIVVAMRHLRRRGASPREAAIGALVRLWRACLLTSLTTAIGFGSLAASSLPSVHRFGVYAACGSLVLYTAVLLVIPLLSLLPWLNHVAGEHERPHHRHPCFAVIGRLIMRHSRLISLLGVASVLLLAWVGWGVPFDMHWSEALPSSGETVAAIRDLDVRMGGAVQAYVVIEWPEGLRLRTPAVLRGLADFHQTLDSFADPASPLPVRLGRATSILTVLEGMQAPGDTAWSRVAPLKRNAPERLDRLVDERNRRLLISVPIPEAGARTLLPVFESLDTELQAVVARRPGFRARLTGSSVLSARNLHDVLGELVTSVVMAAGVVFAVLCVAFRSLRLGLLSVVPNSFPLVAIIAALSLSDTPMQVTAALTLCLSLGIAVDDTIHLVTRFRQERERGASVRLACLRAFRAVGEVIVLTTVVLVCGFSTMMLSSSPAIRLFGGLSCLALLAALVGDLIFLPALLLRGVPARRKLPGRDAAGITGAFGTDGQIRREIPNA